MAEFLTIPQSKEIARVLPYKAVNKLTSSWTKFRQSRLISVPMVQIRKDNETHESIHEWMLNLRKDLFYGTIEIHFQKGEIVRVKKEESYEPKYFASFRRKIA